MRTARLGDLLDDRDVLAVSPTAPETVITGVTQESSRVERRWLFCCRPGIDSDGHRHAAEAVRRGAAALMVEQSLRIPVAQIVVSDVARAMAKVSAAFWDHPSERLKVVGVTGTNGKTTVTHLVRAILEGYGWPTQVIGTLSGPLTTPDAPNLQRQLAEAVGRGRMAVAMEVSSHGLDQGRVDATRFVAGVFTNLDRDHLDYHGDMGSYFAAKAALFDRSRIEFGVVNRDDRWGRRLLRRPNASTFPYSLDDVENLTCSPSGSRFRWHGEEFRLSMPGRFNVSNALSAATVASRLGVPIGRIASSLAKAAGPPGRLEPIDEGQSFRLFVDCAHTPSALRQVLDTLQPKPGSRLIVVFGCGGDRDRTKRPEMGAHVAGAADVAILTADNPRSEPLARIFADVMKGGESERLVLEPDRRRAIHLAIGTAAAGDTVLIAGKGDQTVQQFAHGAVLFDDRLVAREALASLTTPV